MFSWGGEEGRMGLGMRNKRDWKFVSFPYIKGI
jgi:hypothetical protein